MATCSSPFGAQSLDDMIACPLCGQVFSSARVLPCSHTLCLRCIEHQCSAADCSSSCPVCSREFEVPGRGCRDLPGNVFVEKLLAMKAIDVDDESSTKRHCDVCSGQQSATEPRCATSYCVECQQCYCEQCSVWHTRTKSTSNHAQVVLGAPLDLESLLSKLGTAACHIHRAEDIALYCLDCDAAICYVCKARYHGDHECHDVETASKSFRGVIDNTASDMETSATTCREALSKIEEDERHFASAMFQTTEQILDATEAIKKLADDHCQQLLVQLTVEKLRKSKRVETAKLGLEQHDKALVSLHQYCQDVRSRGTATDVARAFSDIKQRSHDLLKLDIGELEEIALRTPAIAFLPLPHEEMANVVGRLDVEKVWGETLAHREEPCTVPTETWDIMDDEDDDDDDDDESDATDSNESTTFSPVLKFILAKGHFVSGVTLLRGELFIVRTRSKDIEVYDSTTLEPLRRMPVPQLGNLPLDLASCPKNRWLYVTDYKNSCVHRVEPTWKGGVLSWPVAKWPIGVSVNKDRNVIITCGIERKLQICTPHGDLLSEVNLCAELRCPQHAVQLAADEYVVTQHNATHCICVVNGDGQITAQYQGTRGFGPCRERRPGGLAISRRGRCVLVADGLSNNIVAVDTTLTKARVVTLPIDEPMSDPCRLCLDERAGKLFVGEGNGGRVLVFDNFRKLKTLLGATRNSACRLDDKVI